MSETPGLERRRRKTGVTLYWRAANLSTKAAGYPDQSIRLPNDATPEQISDLCHSYTLRLKEWLAGIDRPRYLYDGTIGSLCDAFERHPESPIHAVKDNTADSYVDSLKVVRATIGARAVRAVVAVDALRWYRNWRAPAVKRDPETGVVIVGPERIKRAHSAISSLRMILRFGGAMGHAECIALDEQLSKLRFQKSGRRKTEMTLDQVQAFIDAALALGRLPMAIGVAAQFETMVRQKDVIGEYGRDGQWSGSFTWENIPGGIWRLQTSKTATPAVFDLTRFALLWPLLQAVPQAERTGPIVKGHDGRGMKEGRYRKLFRALAGKAGIPTDVWNMDSRAGAITEALEAGADLETVARAATHSKSATTRRYERRIEASITEIAEARKIKRTG